MKKWIPAVVLASVLSGGALASPLTDELTPSLRIGDKAPATLPVTAWIRGEPVTRFKPGHVYIVDSWATWCGVCIEGMPHLSALQRKYGGKLTVIGVNAREMVHSPDKVDPLAVKAKVEASARKHADRMIYTVAMDDPVKESFYDTWQVASGGVRVPNAIIVDGEGRIVWNAPPGPKWNAQFDRAVAAAVAGRSDLALGRAVYAEQYGDGAISMGFYRKLHHLLQAGNDEAVIAYIEAGAKDADLRAALREAGQDPMYRGMVGLTLHGERELSPRLTRLAIGYVETLVAVERPEIPARFLGLAGLYYRLGEQEKGAAAEKKSLELFRASGMDETRLAQISRALDPYRNTSLKIGDPAPRLEPMTWLKGAPVKEFQPGHVYVVEFWATWCAPCASVMPALSELQKKHAGRLTVIGVSVRETERNDGDVERVRRFVQRKGDTMGYTVAMDDPVKKPVFSAWMEAFGSGGIPTSFVVDKTGRVIWMGYATSKEEELHAAVEQALSGKADLAAGLRNQDEMRQDTARGRESRQVLGPLNAAYREKDYRRTIAEADTLVAAWPKDSKYSVIARGRRQSALFQVDEKAAWTYAEELRAGSGEQTDDIYWAGVGIAVAHEPGLSKESYRRAAQFLQAGARQKPDVFNFWFALSRAQRNLGNIPDAIAAQERGIEAARKSGFAEYDLQPMKDTLASLKNVPASLAALQPTLRIGDAAPALEPMAWIKGAPVRTFRPGHAYVVEFWATWCGPCVATMPHMSELQKKYEGRLTVIGVNVREALRSAGTLEHVSKFVEKQGDRVMYTIAMDDPQQRPLYEGWQVASGCDPMPTAFVVDGRGRVVWIGHPRAENLAAFDTAVAQAVAGNSDLEAARRVAREMFGDRAVGSRFYNMFSRQLRDDETRALEWMYDIAADDTLRRAVSWSEDDAGYWSAVAVQIANEDGLSEDTYRLARHYLQRVVAARPQYFASWLGLSRVNDRLGNPRASLDALESALAHAPKGDGPDAMAWLRDSIARKKAEVQTAG